MAGSSSRRPLIGITSYVEQAQWAVWDVPAALVPYDYVRSVEAAGGRALVVPPAPAGTVHDEVLDVLDGLLLTGGADIDPARYGAEPHPRTGGLRPDRDEGELRLLDDALDRDLPVLGVCRGMQVMSVQAGGVLDQHLPDTVGHKRHRPSGGVYGEHGVRLEPGSRVHALLGDSAEVSSYHHQGVTSTGKAVATGWADDGTIEVVEHPGSRFALGVLWHPEVGDDPRLFEALVAAARQTRP